MPGCFVIKMHKFLPQCVGRSEVNGYMMFIEEPPEFLSLSHNNDDVVCFFPVSSSLSALDP